MSKKDGERQKGEREKKNEKQIILFIAYVWKDTSIVGFINDHRRLINRDREEYISWPVTSYELYTCSGLVSICWISIFCIAFDDGCKYWSIVDVVTGCCCCGDMTFDK